MKKITIGILTYNHEKFIEKCLSSVLALKYDNLEIIVSDDCSRDNTFSVVKNVVGSSQTSHKVITNRNEINLGLAQNFNKIFYELASGDFMITLGGDDAIIENYLERGIYHFSEDKDIMMVDFNAFIIDEFDNIKKEDTNLLNKKKINTIQDYLALNYISSFAPGRMFRNDLIKNFDPISAACPTEDSVLVVRALLLGKHCRIDQKVIHYRKHSSNISSIDNLIKLSNVRIVSQYLKDATILYDRLCIRDIDFLSIVLRFTYEFYRREIFYSHQNKYIKKIKLNINKRIYLLKIKLSK